MKLTRKLVRIGAVVGLLGLGSLVGIHAPVNEEKELPQSSPLLDSLKSRQILKRRFIPNYNPLNEWYDSDYYKRVVDSLIKADKSSWYL